MNFDRRTAAVGANIEDIAVTMTTLVHEFVHVEGGDEAEAYQYEQKFLDELYKRGFVNKEQYDGLRSNKDSSVSAHLEGKGGGNEKAACEECLKYGLNPNGNWGLRSQPNDLDRARGLVP